MPGWPIVLSDTSWDYTSMSVEICFWLMPIEIPSQDLDLSLAQPRRAGGDAVGIDLLLHPRVAGVSAVHQRGRA